MVTFTPKNNTENDKRSYLEIVLYNESSTIHKYDPKTAKPLDSWAVEGDSKKPEKPLYTPPSKHIKYDPINSIGYDPYPPENKNFDDINSQLKIDIDLLEQEGKPHKSILLSLKNKYRTIYARTKQHWKNVKQNQKNISEGLIHESFKQFLPILKEIGFEPPGSSPGYYSFDQIIPGGGYKLGNLRWATPKEQAANKCTAPHNQALYEAGIAKKKPSLANAQDIFNQWYELCLEIYPDYPKAFATQSDLNLINAKVLMRYRFEQVSELLPFILETYKVSSGGYTDTPHYQKCNELTGTKLTATPLLNTFCNNVVQIFAYFYPMLATFKGCWLSEKEKRERLEAKKQKDYKDYQHHLKTRSIVDDLYQRLTTDVYCLKIALAIDLQVLPNIPVSLQTFLAELQDVYGVTPTEYRSFKEIYLIFLAELYGVPLITDLGKDTSITANLRALLTQHMENLASSTP